MRRSVPLAVCVVALCACSGDGEEPRGPATPASEDDGEPSLVGATERMAVERANFSLAATIEAEGLEEPVDLTANGITDLRADRSRMRLDFSEILELGGAGEKQDWRGEAIYVGETIYIRMPGLTKALPEPVRWLEVDAKTLAEQGGAQFNAPDPAEFVAFVDAVAEDAQVVGSEEVRNTDTTHYRGTVDLAKLPKVARPRDRAELESYARRLRAAGLESFPLDVWVGDDGVIRRLRTEYEGITTGGPEISLVTSVEFYDFGVETAIEPPPRDEVTPFGDLIGRGAEETKHSEE
jgi:hypothetical protein